MPTDGEVCSISGKHNQLKSKFTHSRFWLVVTLMQQGSLVAKHIQGSGQSFKSVCEKVYAILAFKHECTYNNAHCWWGLLHQWKTHHHLKSKFTRSRFRLVVILMQRGSLVAKHIQGSGQSFKSVCEKVYEILAFKHECTYNNAHWWQGLLH